jgi:hypothetical protein
LSGDAQTKYTLAMLSNNEKSVRKLALARNPSLRPGS